MISNQRKLELLKGEIDKCSKCYPDFSKKNGAIFDNGDTHAELMIVAEAAGQSEEDACLPLIGKCGQLIESMLVHIGLSRLETWRANVCACHPKSNRDPSLQEIINCQPILLAQMEIIKPKVILLLGRFAAQNFLQSEEPIGKLLGEWKSGEGGTTAFVMYHPSYILRSGLNKIDYYKGEFEKLKALLC